MTFSQAAQSLSFAALGNLPRTGVKLESAGALPGRLTENEMEFVCAASLLIVQLEVVMDNRSVYAARLHPANARRAEHGYQG